MTTSLSPAPSVRFVDHADGWSAWLAIPHAVFRYVPTGSIVPVWGALSAKEGEPVSWVSAVPGRPGSVARPSGIEEVADEPLRIDGYECTDAIAAGLFAREPPSGGATSTRFIARVWREN